MKHVSLLIVLIFVSIQGFAQHLTISTSGETGTTGTNWSITGNVLQIASSGTAAIHPSVITNHLTNTGDLLVDLPYVDVLRNININNNILYTGSTNRTLTFKSATDIVVATGVSITSSAASLNLVLRAAVNAGQRGVITLNAPIINTNGGHFWAGGGPTDVTWNSLTVGTEYARTWTFNEIGLSLIGGSISTNGGSIEMKGQSYSTGSTMGTNHGLFINNTSITSGSGSIKIEGILNGKFTNGTGCYIESSSGPVTISSTTGQINILGNGTDIAGTANGWRVGAHLIASNFPFTINSTSGTIIVEGYAAFNNNTLADVEGLVLFSSGTDRLKVTSQSGAISLKGTNTTENLGQYTNSMRFRAANFSNAIRIGYDGTTNYSGNILIEGNSIYQRDNNTGSGSIAIQSTGSLTIQPSSTSFSYLRSGNSGALTFDDDWNFGTTLSSFTYGKTTTTSDISFSNALTVAGAITFNVGTMSINSTLTSTATSGSGIELNGMKIVHNAGNSVLTQGSNIKYTVVNSPVTAANDYGINFLGILASSLKAIINANGGNIDILSSFSNSGVSGGSDRAIIVNFTDILTANSGTINIVGDATNNIATSTCWGFQFINTLIKNNSGSITITGTGGKATPNSRGIAVDASVLRVLSQSGDIIISDLKPVGLTGAYNGGYYNTPTTSDMFIGADGTNIVSSSSNITFKGDKNTFLTSASGGKQFKCTTSGNVIVESIASSFDVVDLSGFKILGTPTIVRLGKTTNTANVTVSNSIATSGAISVYGGDIALNQNITTSANNANVLIKATGQITTNDSRAFQSNNGDFVLWSDSDNSNGGLIWLGLNNVINTANGSTTSGLSGGGKIVLAGGLDNGSNGGVANDGIPDGFAANSINNGVNLGSNNTSNYTQMYSGGGDIIVRGSTSFNSVLNTGTGLWSSGRWIANSGKGSIQINGTSTNYFGVNFSEPASNVTTGNKHIEFISDKATGNAIEITGSSNGSYGVVFNYDNPKELLATGGGAISITGTGGGSLQGMFIQNTDFLANSGDIVFNGGVNGIRVAGSGTRLGSRVSSSITSSTSAIKWITNSIDLYALTGGFTNNFSTSGTVTIEPSGTSFSSAISFPYANLTLANTVSGLTIGKTTNTANVTFSSPTTIAGPITAYGGSIAVTAAISAAGDILLDGDTGNFLTQNTKGVTIGAAVTTSNNGNITILGKGGSGTGYSANHGIDIKNKVEAGGTGNINIVGYGGLSSNGTSSSCHGVNLDVANAWVKSNGGNVIINGFGGGASAGSYSIGVPMQNSSKVSAAGAGTVTITGTGGVNTVAGLRGVVILSSGSVYSAGGAITITGINGTNGTDYSDGVYFDNAIIGSNASGAITISGQAGTGISNAILMNTTNTIGGASHANNIVLRGNNLAFAGTNSVLTTGQVTIEPYLNSFTSALTFPIANLSLANTVSGLTLGKPTNTQNITIGGAVSIAGPTSIYGGTVTLNENIASSNGSTITLFANTLNIGATKTVTSNNGQLIVAPQNTASTIGLAGATGTLSLPAAYFTTNFTDGFSSIQIGSSLQTGAISMNGFTLQDPIHFLTSGNLALGGLPILGNNSVTLDAGIASITGTPTNYFKTTGTGKVIRTISNASTFEFPVGNSTYNPLYIWNTSNNAGDFSIRVIDSVLLNGTAGMTAYTPVVNRTWQVSKSTVNDGNGVFMAFNWDYNDVINGSLVAPKMNYFNGSSWEIPNINNFFPLSPNDKTLEVTNYVGPLSSSLFAISEGTSALPVELTAFNANCTENATTINWQTASEHNSATFEVEKSRDGSNWNLIETVQAAGNSTSILDYSVTDAEQVSGVVYYRLNQIDQNGASKIYGPISANCIEITDFTAIVFPNPTSGMVTIEVNVPVAQTVSIQICGTDGKAIVQMAASLEEGTTQIPLSVVTLKAGVYTVKVNGENTMKTFKLVVQ